MVLVPFRLSEPTCPSLVRLNITQTVAVLCVDLGSSSIQCSSIIWPLSVSDYGSKLWPELKNGCQKESVGLPQAAACMRAKSLWSFLTLCNPKDCRPLGSSVHGDAPGKNTAVGCHFLFQGIFLTQRLNLRLLHCRWIPHHWTTGEVSSQAATGVWISKCKVKEIRRKLLSHRFRCLAFKIWLCDTCGSLGGWGIWD